MRLECNGTSFGTKGMLNKIVHLDKNNSKDQKYENCPKLEALFHKGLRI